MSLEILINLDMIKVIVMALSVSCVGDAHVTIATQKFMMRNARKEVRRMAKRREREIKSIKVVTDENGRKRGVVVLGRNHTHYDAALHAVIERKKGKAKYKQSGSVLTSVYYTGQKIKNGFNTKKG